MQPCTQSEIISKLAIDNAKNETLVEEHGKILNNIDNKIDLLIEKVGTINGQKSTNSFVGGIAAVGILIGSLTADLVKPAVTKILAIGISVIK